MAKHLPLESKQICKRYVHEKQTTEFVRVPNIKSKSFIKSTIKFDNGQMKASKASNWIYKVFLPVLGKSASLKLKNKVRDVTETEPQGSLAEITVWQHPEHDSVFLHLYFYVGNSSMELWMAANKKGYQYVEMPGRFKIRSEVHSDDIVKVSDIDGDGNLELWIHDPEVQAGRFMDCSGDDSDLNRDINCSLGLAKMGEINNGILTYFAKNKPINKTPILHLFKGDKEHPVNDYEPKHCNQQLIKRAIADKFTFKDEADILGLACVENRMHSGRYLVSFFHTITDDDFKLALIDVDVKNRKTYHVYNRTIESDAITNPNNGGIGIDFIDVAENKKAIGLTLSINRSPSCAEASDNNLLSLLIEDKGTYRQILQDMATYMWKLTSGSPCGYNEGGEYTDDSVFAELRPSLSEHYAFKDFDVIHKHQLNMYSESKKPNYKEEKIGSLEFNGKKYLFKKN